MLTGMEVLFRVVERIRLDVFSSYKLWWYFHLFEYLYLGCKGGPFQATRNLRQLRNRIPQGHVYSTGQYRTDMDSGRFASAFA